MPQPSQMSLGSSSSSNGGGKIGWSPSSRSGPAPMGTPIRNTRPSNGGNK